MKYRYIGSSGLAVSKIGLGTATFGQKDWGTDWKESNEILDAYSDLGGNFIDTADKYGDTFSEQIIGKWIQNQNRDKYVIASKCFFQTGSDVNEKGLSKKHIIKACEDSLKRLQTDYIDLYQLHNQDPQTPLEETMSAMDLLVRQGKVRYIGLSNYPAWKVMKLSCISKEHNFPKIISGQYLYNILKRDIEDEIIPVCNDLGMGVICWSPLSGGMLTGKYKDKDFPPKGSRLYVRSDVVKNKFQEWQRKSQNVVEKIIEISKKLNVKPSVIAISWLFNNNSVSSVLVGVKNKEHLIESWPAINWGIPKDEFHQIIDLSDYKHRYPHDVFLSTTKNWFDLIS